jgi:MFS family permease
MEILIWLFVPAIGAAIVLAIASVFRLFSRRQTKYLAFTSSISAGLLGLLIGPRCMCSDVNEVFLGSAAFAVVFGAIVCVFLSLCAGSLKAIQRNRSRQNNDVTDGAAP